MACCAVVTAPRAEPAAKIMSSRHSMRSFPWQRNSDLQISDLHYRRASDLQISDLHYRRASDLQISDLHYIRASDLQEFHAVTHHCRENPLGR